MVTAVDAIREFTDGDRGRLDKDEQIYGSTAVRGAIVNVLEELTGLVLVQTRLGSVIRCNIDGYYAPAPTIGTEVFVFRTAEALAIAHPHPAQVFPQGEFRGTIADRRAGDEFYTANVRHIYTNLVPQGISPGIGVAGLTFDVGDNVLCAVRNSYLATISPIPAQLTIKGIIP